MGGVKISPPPSSNSVQDKQSTRLTIHKDLYQHVVFCLYMTNGSASFV